MRQKCARRGWLGLYSLESKTLSFIGGDVSIQGAGERHQSGFLAWASREAMLFPKLVPVPDTGSCFPGNAIAELVGEHKDLSAMVGLVRKDVSEHACAGGPGTEPASREFADFAAVADGERVGEHAQTLRGALSVSSRSLLHGAAAGIERSRTPEVGGVMAEPDEAAVVEVSEDGGDGTVAACVRQFGTPGSRVEVAEQELVHRVIDGVRLDQDISNLNQRWISGGLHRSQSAGSDLQV